MYRRLKSTLTIMNDFSILTMTAMGLIGLSAISMAKADEVINFCPGRSQSVDRRPRDLRQSALSN